MDIVVVRILIAEPNKPKYFKGTAFFINNNTLVTAKHVVQEAIDSNYKIYISEIPNAGKLSIPLESIKLCKRDIAIISLKKEFEIPPVSFDKNIKVGLYVDLIGYHNEDGAINHYQHNISGYMNEQHTYEIQDARTEGLSGSPILLNGKVCGIAQAKSIDKGVTYIIPISECCYDVEMKRLKKNRLNFKYLLACLLIIFFLFIFFQSQTTDIQINLVQTPSEVLNTKGERLYHKTRYDEAIKYYKKAIELNPKYAQAYSNLGLVYRKLNQYENSISASKEAIKVAIGDNLKFVRASSFYNIARIKEKQEKWKEAEENFFKALLEREHKMYNEGINRMKEKLENR